MSIWIDYFYSFMLGAALLLCAMGLWFTAIVPGIDRWSKCFFRDYFIVLLVCCSLAIAEIIAGFYNAPTAVMYAVLILESLFLSMPLPMLTVYLLHCSGENIRESRLQIIVGGLWIVYFAILLIAPFIGGFTYVTESGSYRGPFYPLLLLPLVLIMFCNLAGTIRRRDKITHKEFLSLLIAILPMTAVLIVLMFVDVYPLFDISFVLSGLAMYSLILSDQIDQDMRNQREIANQRSSIMVLQMRPHFIYNTLMSIYSLCNIDPQKARQVTMDFTDYLRKNFNAVASEDIIPFSAELEHTRAYLAVEQAQYDEMLSVEYDTQFTQFRLPPLTLQPIAENAVKHGIDPYAGPLHITIRTYRAGSASVITVEDDGPGFDESKLQQSHTALTNIRQRLDLMCRGTLEIDPRDGGGTVVKVTIPDRN